MKRMIKSSTREEIARDLKNSECIFRIYFTDGNKKLAGGPGASILDAVNYILSTDPRYEAKDIYKVEYVSMGDR